MAFFMKKVENSSEKKRLKIVKTLMNFEQKFIISIFHSSVKNEDV